MKVWLDAHLSPQIAQWITHQFKTDQLNIEAIPVRDVGLRDASDEEIFSQAKKHQAVLMTKDSDFIHLINRYGVPPQILWLTCGNTSNENLKRILSVTLLDAISLLSQGDDIVEIAER